MPRFGLSIISLVVLALVMTACGDTPPPSASAEPDASGASPAEILRRERGARVRGAVDGRGTPGRRGRRAGSSSAASTAALPGFSFLDEASGEYTGFDVDFCRALAAAVLGDPTLVEFRDVSTDQRGPLAPVGRHRRPDSQHHLDGQPRHLVGPLRTDDVLRRPGDHGELDADRCHDDRRARRRHDLRPVRHDDRAEPDRSARRPRSPRRSSRRSTRPTRPTRRADATRSRATARSWSRGGRRSRTRPTT